MNSEDKSLKNLLHYTGKHIHNNDNNDVCKKAKGTKKRVVKIKLKFKYYKKCLKSSKFINIVNYLEKRGINVDSLKEDKKEFMKNRLILKTQQRFKSERHNVFTEEINKIVLSSNDDKRMQSIDSVETYPTGMGKELIWETEKIKRTNIIRKYKNV